MSKPHAAGTRHGMSDHKLLAINGLSARATAGGEAHGLTLL